MSRPGLLSFVLTSLLIAAAVGAQPLLPNHEIGSYGANLTTNEWKRVKLTENVGKDQFRSIAEERFFLVFEMKSVLDRRADFERKIGETLDRISGRMSQTELEPEMVLERLDTYTRATRRFTGTLNGLDLGYQIDLLSAGDGLAYLFLSWSGKSTFDSHSARMDELLASFSLPGEATEHFKKSQITPHRFDFGPYKVELSFQDSIFAPMPDSKPGERYSFIGDEDELAVHLFVVELEGDIQKALDSVRAAIAEESTQELLQAEIETPAGRGRQLLLRQAEGEGEIEVAIAVIEIDPERFIDLRMVTNAAIGHREELWQRLLASLEVEREAKVEAFPAGKTPVPAKTFLGDAARQLIEGSRYLTQIYWEDPVFLPNGDFLKWEEGQLSRFVVSGIGTAQPEVLATLEAKVNFRGFGWGGQIYLQNLGTQEILKVVDGKVEPAGFKAHRVAAWGNELLYSYKGETKKVLGLPDRSIPDGSRILLRRPGREERQVLVLPELEVLFLAVRDGQALVAAAPPGLSRWDTKEAKIELHLVPLESGRTRALEPWIWVRSIFPSPRGWLISGIPDTGVDGVYLHSGQGGRELLISGSASGLYLDETKMIFVLENCPQVGRYNCAYEAPLELVRRHGPGFWPWGESDFAAIATAAAARMVGAPALLPMPESRETLTAFLAAANEESIKRTGWPLPTSTEAIDEIFDRLAASADLGPYGGALIGTLLTQGLLDAGAEWVPPTEKGPFGLYLQIPSDNPFAIRAHPPAIVRFSGGEGGWHSPVRAQIDAAKGRTILVGPDPRALDQRLRQADLASLPELLRQGTDKSLAALLAQHPKNIELRQHVYEALAARQRFEVLAKVAAPWAAATDANVVDILAWAAGRLEVKLTQPEVEEMIDRLKAAIEHWSYNSSLYLQLGAAYEKSSMPDKALFARACYDKTLEISEWGENAEDAKAALARLGQAQP